MGKGLLPAADRLVDRVNRLVRAGLDSLTEARDPAPTPEQALLLVRDRLGKLIAERRQLQRRIAMLPASSTDLSTKAEFAIRKGREDLARAALSESSRAHDEQAAATHALAELDADIALLEEAIAQLSNAIEPTRAPPLRALLAELDRLAREDGKPGSGA